ncbi:ArsC/Spx/MgsR family protein [Lactococcus garvieae]|uniref:ArsC/Spx/MgsR family protein n=1 Tax=Lactococcus garvieae TaxID=1363 RepID=UPI0009C04F6F
MIVLYYTLSNISCRKAINWFHEKEIPIAEKNISDISKSDLIHTLRLSENGFLDLLRRPAQCKDFMKSMIEDVLEMSFNDSVKFILSHPEILRLPLIIDKNKYIVGYNTEKIRIFISRAYRNTRLN